MESDLFCFKVNISSRPATHRGILSVASAIFYPLGFLPPFILIMKKILQDPRRIMPRWDDEILAEYTARLKNWLIDVSKLLEFAVSQCLEQVDFGAVESSQSMLMVQ